MSGLQQKNVEAAAAERPEDPPEKIIERGRKQPKQKQIIVSIGDAEHEALQKFAQDEGTTQDEAASSLIESGLSGKGYL